MMIEPPIDKLIKKAECRYALVIGVANRAKQLATSEAEYLEATHQKPISVAAKEVYDGRVIITRHH